MALCGLFAAVPPAAAAELPADDACTRQAVAEERAGAFPPGLLHAIAIVESGIDGRPQAWAVAVGGRSIYPKSRAQAVRLLRDGAGAPRRGATVGCMQLSVEHHAEAFQPLERILDAAANVGHAARYLARLKDQAGSWGGALARYQGGRPEQQRAYQCKVWSYLRVLAPASATLLDARTCVGLPLPHVDPATVDLARRLRRSQ